MGRMRNEQTILDGKHEEKWPLWRTSHRWEEDVKMDLEEWMAV